MYVAGFGENDKMQLGHGIRSYQENAPVGCSVMGDNVVQVDCGYFWSAALLDDGTIRTWGGNGNGELCDGTDVEKYTPVKPELERVKQIAVDGPHGIALVDDGTVRTWGGNAYGERGDGTIGGGQEGTSAWNPVRPEIANIVKVEAGGANDGALTAAGQLWLWGANNHKQIGDGTQSLERTVPQIVPNLDDIIDFSIGGLSSYSGHVLALLSDGTVMAWGSGKQGELGLGRSEDVGTPTPIPGLSGVIDVIAGPGRSFFILDDGSVLGCGSNQYAQLCVPLSEVPDVALTPIPVAHAVEISPGMQFTLMRSASGEIKAWGRNQNGQLGDGTKEDKLTGTIVKIEDIVMSISAGEHHSILMVDEPLSGPPMRITSETGSVRVDWDAPGVSTSSWHVRWRPITFPATTVWAALPPAPANLRSQIVANLVPGEQVEVSVQNPEWLDGAPREIVGAAL